MSNKFDEDMKMALNRSVEQGLVVVESQGPGKLPICKLTARDKLLERFKPEEPTT